MTEQNAIQPVIVTQVPQEIITESDQLVIDGMALAEVNKSLLDIDGNPKQDMVLRREVESLSVFFKTCKKASKRYDEQRLDLTKPIRASIDHINSRFKEYIQKPLDAIEPVKRVIANHESELQRRVIAENQRIAEENRKAAEVERQAQELQEVNTPAGTPLVPIVIPRQQPTFYKKTAPFREVWTHKVEKRFKNHDNIVSDYLRETGKFDDLFDMAIREMIKKEVKAKRIDELKISGVIIAKEKQLVAR